MKAASTPQHDLIYCAMKRQLRSKTYRPGDRLPPIRQVAKQFGVNANVAYAALKRLEHDRLVVAKHGSGIFVADSNAATRNVLLLNAFEGHVWAELTHGFIERFSGQQQHRLTVEAVPDVHSGQLPAFREKLRSLAEDDIDTVIFNGIPESGAHLVLDVVPADVEKLCFFSRASLQGADADIGGVISDWYHGGYVAAKHLMEAGCRHLVVIMPFEWNKGIGIPAGCMAAAADSVVPPKVDHFVCPDLTADPDAQVKELLRRYPDVDGILTHADFIAAAVVLSLQRHGRRVPEDVAVVGYYNTAYTDMVDPHLTSIDPRCRDIANTTVDLCLAGRFSEHLVIHPRLVVRESSRRPTAQAAMGSTPRKQGEA